MEDNCGRQSGGDASDMLYSLMNQLPAEKLVSVSEATSIGTGEKQVQQMLPVKTSEPIQTANSEMAAALSLAASSQQQQQVVSTSITTSGSNPLQVSVKTVPGTNTVVNQTLINNIVNSDAVQTLLRDNPGQPITIVRMPDSMQIPRFNFPLTPLNNLNWNNLKTRKRNASQLPSRGRRGRKPKLGDMQQERTDVLQFQKSLQFKTRSGRVSKPPLYRVKETLHTPKSDLAEPNSNTTVTNDRLDPANDMSADEINSNSERSPLETSGRSTLPNYSLRGQASTRRGFRGYSKTRRSRARVGNLGNRLSPSEKLKELLTEISDDDFVTVVLPKLSEIISCWEFLMMRAHIKSDPKRTLLSTILEEFNDVLHEIRSVGTPCMHPVPEEGISLDAVNTVVEVSNGLAEALGKRKGSYIVGDIPSSQIPSRVSNILNSSAVPEERQNVMGEKNEEVPEDVTHFSEKPFQSSASRKLADRILGVDTIFPDNALKSKQTTTAESVVNETSSLPTLCEKSLFSGQSSESTEEASSLMVNVEELEPGGLHPVTSDLNLQQAVQSTDSNVLSGQDATPLKESSLQASTSVLDIEPAEVDHTVIEGLPADSLTRTDSYHQSANSPMMPEGSTIMQMADGNFLVQKPDGTAMQIQAPEGMTIETIQALLSMETEVFEGDQTETE